MKTDPVSPVDPASPTCYAPGELAQCDLWFPNISLPVGFGQSRTAKALPVLTMVSGYSRWLSALLIASRAAQDLFDGWWRLIAGLGGVPRLFIWDGEGAVGRYRREASLLRRMSGVSRHARDERLCLQAG